MNFIASVAKLVVIIIYLCILLLASNRHGKNCSRTINFWSVLAMLAGHFILLAVGGFFDGFLNFGV